MVQFPIVHAYMNQRQLRRPVACIVLLCLSCPGIAQEGVQQAQVLLGQANAAYASKDYGAQVRHLEAALDLNPASLRTRYNLACAYALHGQETRALQALGELVNLGVDYGMADDPDLLSLRNTPAFAAMLERLEPGVRPVVNSRHLATVEELGLIPEGIAHDAGTGRIFFGSMRNGAIYVLEEGGRLSRFATIGLPGFSAIGLTVDERRKLLWAIGTATDLAAAEMGTATEEVAATETGTATEEAARAPTPRTGVFGFDLESGAAADRFLADPSNDGFNDVTVAPNGDLYLSGARLSVLVPANGEIRPLPTSPVLVGTNGIVVSPDGNRLFTSVYPVGIAVVELPSGQADFLKLPESSTLYGVDGLYMQDDDLIAIQNGTEPWRLLRIELDERQRAVTAIRVLERAHPAVTPTTGAISGNEIIYVGQGPAPDPVPTHVPEPLVPFFGKTLIMAAPLD